MPFSVSWHTILEEADGLPPDATLVAPLTHERFRITDTQEHRIVIEFHDSGESQPLQRDQFEALYQRVTESIGGFDLDNLPSGAEPYAAAFSLHPRFEIDETAGKLLETEGPTSTQVVDENPETVETERTEPDLAVYSDALLLIDTLERHDLSTLETLDTDSLVNLYTLLSDVQREANDFRQEVADVLLDRIHHDQPVHSHYGSVQRTTRRNRSLKDEREVLEVLADAGIDRDRVMGLDRDKVEEALEVTTIPESKVYEIEEREYVRKAEVDEEVKETRLQGLKDRLAATEDEEADELRQEIEALEERIDELTSFRSGAEMAE